MNQTLENAELCKTQTVCSSFSFVSMLVKNTLSVCVCVAHMKIKRSNKGQLVESGSLLPTVVLKSGPTTGQQLLLPAKQSHQSFLSLTSWLRVWVPSSNPRNLFPGGLTCVWHICTVSPRSLLLLVPDCLLLISKINNFSAALGFLCFLESLASNSSYWFSPFIDGHTRETPKKLIKSEVAWIGNGHSRPRS